MFCPACRYEYIKGISECPDCRVPLVAELPPRPQPEFVELVTVLETGDPALIMVAKSLLEGTGMRYLVKGEGLQDLFALGRFGTGFNPLVGPVRIQVGREDEAVARALLAGLGEMVEE